MSKQLHHTIEKLIWHVMHANRSYSINFPLKGNALSPHWSNSEKYFRPVLALLSAKLKKRDPKVWFIFNGDGGLQDALVNGHKERQDVHVILSKEL